MTNLDDIKAWLASGPIIDCARQLSVEVDLGRPPKSITFAGTNAVVTSTKEGIWATGGVFRYPASVGSQLEFVFTGEDYRIVEDIRASTAAAVTTTATDITDIIEWYGVSFGSLGHAENAVTMQIEGGGTVLDTLSAGTDAPHSARLYVPAEHIGVLPWWATSITATATSTPPADMWLAHDWDFARGEHRGAAIAVDWQSVTETGWTTTEPAVPFLVPAGTRIDGIRAGADDAVVKAKAEVLLYSEPEHQANQCQ